MLYEVITPFVVLGGGWSCNKPMAVVREIIRQKIGNLKVMSIVGGWEMEWLLASPLPWRKDCPGEPGKEFSGVDDEEVVCPGHYPRFDCGDRFRRCLLPVV